MKKRTIAVLLTMAMAATMMAGCGSKSDSKTADGEKSYTIGISQFAEHGSLDNCREGFLEGLKEEGIEEGKNLNVEYKNSAADMGTASQIASSFVSDKVDLICGIATPSAQTAYNAAMDTDISVIYTAVTDPKAAEEIHAHNIKRVIRALEFYHQTGQLISEHNEKERQKESPYQFVYFVLNDDRQHLYQRIDRRVDQMMEEGLVEEVKRLKAMGCTRDMVSMQGLGYKEILAYLDGECSIEEAVYTIKRDTRHFAKRQITWFKRERQVIWINKEIYDYDEDRILQTMVQYTEDAFGYKD